MRETQPSRSSIGAEIPYRRDRIDKPTGSLVFDQHLKQTQDDAGSSAMRDPSVKPGHADAGRA